MWLNALSKWLSSTDLSMTIKTVAWIIPAIQTVHIIAIAVVFSSALLLNLRIWQLVDRASPIKMVGDRYLPKIWPALIVLALTGIVLIIGEPKRSLENTSFQAKMVCLLVAILITFLLQALLARRSEGDTALKPQIYLQVLAALSTLVWIVIIFAGRWIAYSQV